MGYPTDEPTESSRVCAYCGEAVGTEADYLRHLARAHDPDRLGRIDRRRVGRAFDGRRTWWTDLLGERLARTPPVTLLRYVASLDSPVPRRTLLNLALLGAGLSLAVAVVLAAGGP